MTTSTATLELKSASARAERALTEPAEAVAETVNSEANPDNARDGISSAREQVHSSEHEPPPSSRVRQIGSKINGLVDGSAGSGVQEAAAAEPVGGEEDERVFPSLSDLPDQQPTSTCSPARAAAAQAPVANAGCPGEVGPSPPPPPPPPTTTTATINGEQLKEFVAMQVPERKRVLCLIVRDKMSRLNKAKSYFYPTYYLFIQAIVDIDTDSLMMAYGGGANPPTNGADHQQQHSPEDIFDDQWPYLTPMVKYDVTPPATSADNSFSNNEDDDEEDDDDDCDELDEEDESVDESSGKQQQQQSRDVHLTGTNFADNGFVAAAATAEEGNCVERLFDNDYNPYSGTYGVLLASRRRKKGKT